MGREVGAGAGQPGLGPEAGLACPALAEGRRQLLACLALLFRSQKSFSRAGRDTGLRFFNLVFLTALGQMSPELCSCSRMPPGT